MIGMIRSGVSGMQNGIDQVNKSGKNIREKSFGKTVGIIEDIVDLTIGENKVKLNKKVIQSADEILGTIIDLKK